MKLGEKDKARLRLGLWAGILTWMAFFVAYSVVMARSLAREGPSLFGSDSFGQVLTWIVPIWSILTALLICLYIGKFVSKRISK